MRKIINLNHFTFVVKGMYKFRLEEMKESLLECNYSIKLINDSMEKA